MSRGNPTQPPLDLRLLSHSSPLQQQSQHQPGFQTSSQHHQNHQTYHQNKEKVAVDDNNRTATNKVGKKDDTSPDWGLMSVKRNKDKEAHKGLKIPDWSVEEERRFRLDTESKETPSLKRCVAVEPIVAAEVTTTSSKKRSGKRHNAQDAGGEIAPVATEPSSHDMQIPEKKSSPAQMSSPLSNRKGKSKEETVKLVDYEVQADASNAFTNSCKNEGSKRKQSTGSNNGSNSNPNSYRKYEANASQKVTQYSEEETSSTTTESSVQEDNTFKDCENTCEKTEKTQRKPVNKKPKPQTIPVVPSSDYKDNYEGDCDDDDYDKEKQDNPNRWKTSTTRSGSKHHLSRLNTESSHKLPRQKQNPARKEKASQKRRNAEKNQSKAQTANGITSQKEEVRPPPATVSPPLPPPPSVCWGENRAKFSDVVARNQDNLSPFPNYSNNKSTTTSTQTVPASLVVDSADCTKRKPVQELTSTEYKFNAKTPSVSNEKDGVHKNKDPLGIQSNSHINSYFVNTFNEPSYEPELVPYDDLPETDEPLVELENADEDLHCSLWHDNSPILNLLPENPTFKIDSSKSSEKMSNLPDTLKDNWVTVETNWEPLYTRGAVGEERSGVWGINTGGVWAAAPWGAPTPPSTLLQPITLSQQREPNIQEGSGFDPFRSLSTIWTPSSSDSWTSKQKE